MTSVTRILFLIDELDIGGTEQQLLELVKRLDRKKYLPLVCCFRPGRVAQEIEALGVRVFTLRKRKKIDLRLVFSLWQLMRQEKVDLVQTYLFTANTWGRLAAIMARVPLIVSSERNVNIWEESYKHWLGRILDYWTHGTIANSQAVKEYLIGKGVASEKIRAICNGVDLQRFESPPASDQTKAELGIPLHHRVICLLARLEPQKDPHTFLEAAALLKEKVSDVSFLIIGDGSLRQDLEQQAQTLGIADQVVFAGFRREVPKLIALSDISVNTSLKEGMANTIMESMAAGKPVVATPVGGNAELVQDGETGMIIPQHGPPALAAAVYKILTTPQLGQQMGQHAKDRIRQLFSVDAMVAATEQCYDVLTGSTAQTAQPNLAFIASQFPRYVDAYFLREVKALAERGLGFQIFSLRGFSGKHIHQDAEALLSRTVYLPYLFSWRLFRAHAYFLIRNPKGYFGTLWTVLRGCWKRPRALFRTLAVYPKAVAFAKLVQDRGIRHVHANWATHPATAAWIIARLTGVTWSFTGHASDIFLDTTMLADKLHAAQFAVTCTRYNKDYLSAIGGGETQEKIAVNYHGVDLKKFVPGPRRTNARFRILTVGTLLPCKGLPDLVEACRILAQRGVAFDCTIVGDGPERRALERQVQRSGLHDRIALKGYMSQEALIPLYQTADVVTLPALSESHFGIPNILLEALSVETPVVCTRLPSLSEVIEDKKHGLYIPEHCPQALADALEGLSRNPDQCQALGKAGRLVIETLFDTDKNVNSLEALFEHVQNRNTGNEIVGQNIKKSAEHPTPSVFPIVSNTHNDSPGRTEDRTVMPLAPITAARDDKSVV